MSPDLLQWPAMLVTLLSTWLVASQRAPRRAWGFGTFLLSNALWVAWGWHAAAWALVLLQVLLAVMNLWGLWRNRPRRDAAATAAATAAG